MTSKSIKSFLTFTQNPPDPTKLTLMWTVSATSSLGFGLDFVKWWPAWRKYCFFPNVHTVYDPACLTEIATFCSQQTELQKQDQARRRGEKTEVA